MDHTVLLPGGFVEEDGTINREAVITEMTGKTQTILGRRDLQKKPLEMINKVVADCLESFAGRDNIGASMREDMLAGDRDYLLIEIRKASLGNMVTQEFQCGNENCGVTLYEEVDLEKLTVWDLPEVSDKTNISVETIDTPKGSKLTRLWTTRTESGDMIAVGRHVSCKDMTESMNNKNPILTVQNLSTRILHSITINGEEHRGPFDANWLADQPFRVVTFLQACVGEQACGPQLLIKTECPECDHKQEVQLDISGFFISSTERRERGSMLTKRSGSSAQ